MGTFHSFISQPFLDELDAQTLKRDIERVIDDSSYRNSINNFQILKINSFFVVVGLYKNLGGAPIELIVKLMTTKDWATVSNEGNFCNSLEE